MRAAARVEAIGSVAEEGKAVVVKVAIPVDSRADSKGEIANWKGVKDFSHDDVVFTQGAGLQRKGDAKGVEQASRTVEVCGAVAIAANKLEL